MPRHLDAGHPCPCTSGLAFGACCRALLRNEREAPDPVSLMRSRFTAFALENVEHLLRTLAPDHPARARPAAEVLRDLRRAARAFDYRSLTILDHEGPDGSGRAQVLFLAGLFDRGKDRSFVERSQFVHDGQGFRYLSGDLRAASEIAEVRALRLATFTASPPAAPAR